VSKVIVIGEALIDFIPKLGSSKLKDVDNFKRVAGGAPANVSACVSRLGGESILLTKLGLDSFGDHIIDMLEESKVNTKYIKRTNKAKTGLAFVSLTEDGEREFEFFRNPSSDLLFHKDEIDSSIFNSNDILHFCSVDLVESDMKDAHRKAIDIALSNKCIISFDPNLRFPLWDNLNELKDTVNEFIDFSHIIKVSLDELEFITSETEKSKALNKLFRGNVKVVVLTDGPNGAFVYTKDNHIYSPSLISKVRDTTGAGDAFIGSILYKVTKENITLDCIDKILDKNILEFAHKVSSYVVQREGVIDSLPWKEDIK